MMRKRVQTGILWVIGWYEVAVVVVMMMMMMWW